MTDAPPTLVAVAGPELAVLLDPTTGAIIAVRDPDGRDLALPGPPLLRVGVRPADRSAVVPSDSSQGEVTITRDRDTVVVTARWESGLAAAVQISPDPDGVAFTAQVWGAGDATLEWLELPGLRVPNDLAGPDGPGRVLWPFAEGVEIDDLTMREGGWLDPVEPDYPSRSLDAIYPGSLCSPLIAHYDDRGGLLLSAHDRTGAPKLIDHWRDGDGIALVMRSYLGGAAGQADLGHAVVLSHVSGGWQGAAERHRDWYEREPAVAPLRNRDDLPSWYAASPVVVTYPLRGSHDTGDMQPNRLFPPTAGLPMLERLAARVGAPVMALLMHWEGTAPWAPPYVWPPYGGAAELAAFAGELHSRGHLLGLYCSGMGWTQRSRLTGYDRTDDFTAGGWDSAVCRGPDGSLLDSTVCTDQRQGYDLCPADPRVAAVLADELRAMVTAGADYVQLFDQNHGGHGLFCYDTRHGHGPGPGPWQTAACSALQQDLVAVGGGALLGAEFTAGEPYLGELALNDLRFNLGYTIGTAVGLFQYLHHSRVINFLGNQVAAHYVFDHARSPDNLLFRIARAASVGELTTLVMDQHGRITWNWGSTDDGLPDQEAILDLAAELARWRAGAAGPFLNGGRMLPAPTHRVTDRVLHRVDQPDLTVPQVLMTRWQDDTGRIGHWLVNWTREEATVELTSALRPADAAGPACPYSPGTFTLPALEALLLLEP